MHDARDGRLGPGIVLDQAVQERGIAAVADAVDVAGGFGGVDGIEGWEFRGVGAGGREEGFDFSGGAGSEDARAADGGQFEAREGRLAGCAFAVDVVAGAGGGAFHIVVVEAFQDVEVRVRGDVGDDVDLARVRLRGLFPRVGGVESEERVRFEHSDEALAVPSIDYEPEVLPAWFKVHGIEQVSRPEDLDTAFRVIGVEYAEDHKALCQQY